MLVSSREWPVAGSIPRTAPTFSEPKRMFLKPLRLVNVVTPRATIDIPDHDPAHALLPRKDRSVRRTARW